MELYYRVSRDIRPKRVRLSEAEAIVAATRADLLEKEKALAATSCLRSLTDELARITAEKLSLQQQISACELKLGRANKLMSGLGGERVRWAQAAVLYAQQATRVLCDSLLASAMVAYMGPYTQAYRSQIMERWVGKLQALGLEVGADFSLRASAGDAVTIRSGCYMVYRTITSPSTMRLSLSVAALPLCIDPQGQVLHRFVLINC